MSVAHGITDVLFCVLRPIPLAALLPGPLPVYHVHNTDGVMLSIWWHTTTPDTVSHALFFLV